MHLPQGKAVVPGGPHHVLGMHFGRPVRADCAAGDVRVRGLQKPGDMDFVPAGVDGSWEDDADCHILRVTLDPSLLSQAAEDLGHDAKSVELVPRLRLRDPGIEAILNAVKADLDAPMPSDTLYVDHLSHALAIRLLATVTAERQADGHANAPNVRMPAVVRVIEFIEANLDRSLHLIDLAVIAGLSITRLKMAFRATMGMPIHQYVIRRRTEVARTLIATTTMPMSQVAHAAGFAHQSHMATTMRRLLGQTPGEIGRPPKAPRPILQKNGPNLSEDDRPGP